MWMAGILATVRWSLVSAIGYALVVLLFTACSVGVPVTSLNLIDISEEDRKDLRSGNLLAVRERYEQRGIVNLSEKEVALLCDIFIKHMSVEDAIGCLNSLESQSTSKSVLSRVTRKRALIAYLLGQYQRAAALSKDLQEKGGRYVYALAQSRIGDTQTALDFAERWAVAFDPESVFLAANLYLSLERYSDVLSAMYYPEPGLARHYSLTETRNIFGQQVQVVPLKIDLFDEFGFGLLGTYSFAPAYNIYSEYLLAKAHLETGGLEEARKRLDTILHYPYIEAFREVQWRALYECARIAMMDGDDSLAIELNQRAIEIIEDVRASISTEVGRIGFVGNKQAVYADLIDLLLEQGDVASAFEYSERARSRALVDVLATQRRFGGQSALQVKLSSFVNDYQRAENRVLEIQGTQNPDLGNVQFRATALDAEHQNILKQAPILRGLLTVESVHTKLEKIQPLLQKSGETLLSYFKAGDTWYVFTLKHQGKPEYRQLDLPNLAQEVGDFRRVLASGDRGLYEVAARRLYDKLIRPVEGRLSKILTIVPYGELHYAPFAALHSGSGFLIEKHILRTIPSAEVMRILGPSERPKGSLLALGNPLRRDAVPLPFAEKEARRVAEIYRPSELLLGTDASLSKFTQMARYYDILHIAAHGEFNKFEPLQSRLLLSPSPGDTGDLTAADLYSIEPRLNINIAVLSACDTALADISKGDELIGLQRGFLYAGADSIVGSLWRVSDQATVYLMEQFYTSLRRTASRAEALREAQLMSLKHDPSVGTWAAFTYTGSLH